MEISLPVHAALHKGYILLKETCQKDHDQVMRLFEAKTEKEERLEQELFVQARLSLPHPKRTFKQNAAVWVLVTAIFESMENRKPTEEEKYNLYLDLLDLYADKVPSRFTGGLRPVHISESNTVEGAKLIEGLIFHLSTECNMSYDITADVIDILQKFEAWKGQQAIDPCDYRDIACTSMLPEGEWRKKHPYSEASAKNGPIVRAHIVSRGADGRDIEASWNWLALTWEEHQLQHDKGWDYFLRVYPHLKGRVDRARRLAGKMDLEQRSVKSLAYKAMEA